ncbi:hypothetical protein C8R43DRAFT_958812 [Mycena crocata]|nr:hypothetical protein C8R43DRAFT_958812 [Mycena crocata]
MQFTLSKLFALVAAAQAISMTAAVNVGSGAANVNVGIACVNNNLGGTCGDLNLNALPSVCVNVTPQFNDNISSFRLNSGVRCVFYKDGACTGSSRSFTGTTNDLFGDALQDNISAYQCFSRPRAERDSRPTENQFLRNKLQARSDGQRASTGHGSRVKVPVNSTVQQYSFNDGVNGPQHVLALINQVFQESSTDLKSVGSRIRHLTLDAEINGVLVEVFGGTNGGLDGHTAQKLVVVKLEVQERNRKRDAVIGPPGLRASNETVGTLAQIDLYASLKLSTDKMDYHIQERPASVDKLKSRGDSMNNLDLGELPRLFREDDECLAVKRKCEEAVLPASRCGLAAFYAPHHSSRFNIEQCTSHGAQVRNDSE